MLHDIYNPPPAPIPWNPKPEPLVFTGGDLVCLATLCSLLGVAALIAWPSEPMMAVPMALGGSLVILESWFTALGFLHRRKRLGLRARWTVFLAALVPWLVELGVAASLMIALFAIFDWFKAGN
jgi:hypothetical protein